MKRRSFLGAVVTGAVGMAAGCSEEESTDREQGTGDADDSNGGNSNGEDAGGGDSDGESESSSDGSIELLSHEWYDDGQFSAGVQGQVENTSGETLSYVEVDVYFIDADGVQFEESLDNTSDLAADRVWEFDAMFLGDDTSRVESYEVEASTTAL